VSTAQIDRDHFISHVLSALSDLDPATRFFGGTALCRTYLVHSRLSEDIDLLHPDPRSFLAALAVALPTKLRREFPGTSSSEMVSEGDGYAYRLGPPELTPIKVYAGRDGHNTRAWEFTRTEVVLRYRDLPDTTVFECPTPVTFAAMKLAAWSDRHAPRDLFDLSGLAEVGILGDPAAERMYRAKLGTGIIGAEFERVSVSTARSWESELAAQVGELPDVQSCLRGVRDALTHVDGSRA
jgi:hypothetical protein